MSKPKFSFIVAYENEDGRLSSYSFGGEVKYDTLKAAKEFCRYANANDVRVEKITPYNVYGMIKIDL